MAKSKIEGEKIKDLPAAKPGKGKAGKKADEHLTPEELDKATGGITTHLPGNPI